MPKLITVFGATGNQGGSVIKHILSDPVLSKEFRIRGITRDSTKPAAQALAAKGVELVNADMNSQSSVEQAIQGSHTVFLVTNYWETASASTERQQGINVADACVSQNISHLVFSSLLNVSKLTYGRLPHVPHFDSKADIEEYIKGTDLNCSFVLAGYFMTNFFMGMLNKGEDGVVTLAYPIGEEAKFPLIDVAEDFGKFVLPILRSPQSFNKKRVLASSGYLTPPQILSDFSSVTGLQTRFVKLDHETYKSFLPEFMAEEMLENHLLIEAPGYYYGENLEDSLKLVDGGQRGLRSWKEWVEVNKGTWM